MKANPDELRDNVRKIYKNIDDTICNMEMANIMMDDNPQTKKELKAKNERREQAVDGMRNEIKDEANYN